MSPYLDVYRKHRSENASPITIKRMARTFKQLEVTSPRDEVVRRFAHYMAATPARFYSVERFADTYPDWKDAGRSESTGGRLDPLPNETTDQYIQRQAKAGIR